MLIYAGVAAVAGYALYMERTDLHCPTFNCHTSMCGERNGVNVYPTKMQESDTVEDLLSRIDYSTDIDNKRVIWRRALLVAIVTTFLIFALLHWRIPSEKELLIAILVITVVTYFVSNYYIFHQSNHVRDNIKEITDTLRRIHLMRT